MSDIIKRNQRYTNCFSIVAICALLGFVPLALRDDIPTSNLYLCQAEAFLHGRLDIPEKLLDVAVYQNRYYVPFPPFPAVLLLPLKAVFAEVNTTIVSVGLTIVNVFVAKDILQRLKTCETKSSWLLLGFFLGTGYWLAVIWSDGAWYFAHVVCVTFVLLSIREALGSGRGLIAGLFLGFAFLSRQLSIYSSVFITLALLGNQSHGTKKSKAWALLGFGAALGSCVVAYLAFNYYRFGSPFDTGYSYLDLESFLESRFEQHGLWSLAYAPFNLIYMFFQGPHLEFRSSLAPQGMDPFGTSITFASPFLFLAFFAKGSRLTRVGAWVAVGLTFTHAMLYYNNGWVQPNTQRFTLDFLPLLLVLMGLATRRIEQYMLWVRLAVVYSISLNIVALVLFPLAHQCSAILGEVL